MERLRGARLSGCREPLLTELFPSLSVFWWQGTGILHSWCQNGGFHFASFWLWYLLCPFISGRTILSTRQHVQTPFWALKFRNLFMSDFRSWWHQAGVEHIVGHLLRPLGWWLRALMRGPGTASAAWSTVTLWVTFALLFRGLPVSSWVSLSGSDLPVPGWGQACGSFHLFTICLVWAT